MWGLTGVFVRLLPPLSPFFVTSARLLGSLVVALPILATSNAKRLDLKVAVKNPAGYLLASFLVGYYLLATAAFQLAPVAEVALLLSTPPLFVLALRGIRGDVPTVIEILGASLALAGIALILDPRLTRPEKFVNARLIGDAMAIGAALFTAFYAYVYRELAKNGVAPESSSITFMTFSLGSLVLSGLACLMPTTISWEALRGTSLPLFLGLAVLCTAIPSFAFAFASKRLPPVVTATVSLLIPLFAGAFAYLILGEKIPSTAIPGSALVVVGIVMILRENRRTTPYRTSSSPTMLLGKTGK
jgi:DME family drug/metabolite transporter